MSIEKSENGANKGADSPKERPGQETAEGVEQRPPTAEDLDRYKKELEQKIEDERVRREKDTDQKIIDRESLIAQLKENDNLLTETRKILEGYRNLTDSDSVAKIGELESLVGTLEKNGEQMVQQVETISNTPDVLNKLQLEGLREDYRIEYAPLLKEFNELHSVVFRLGNEIETLSQEKPSDNSHWESSIGEKKRSAEESKNKAKEFLKDKLKDFDGNEFVQSLLDIFNQSKSSEEIKQQMEGKKQSLGLFQRKEKKAIENILRGGHVEMYFKNYEAAQKEALTSQTNLDDSKKNERERRENTLAALAEKYRSAISKGWEIENRMIELAKERGVSPFGPSYKHFSKQLASTLDKKMEDQAGFTRFDNRKHEMEVVYRSWNEATRNRPGTKAMFDTWQEVVNRAGGSKLAEVNPAETQK